MDGKWKWKVEAKEFELVVRGGNTGVRFYERSCKSNRSIFLQRAEVAWLDGVVEDLVAKKTTEVFWDQSRAGYLRILVERCSNQHGKFLTIVEFDGRHRSGSIMIPEGRHGQGWNRLKLEVSRVNSSLGVREKWKYNTVTVGRSYADAVMATQAGGSEVHLLKNNKAPVSSVDASKTVLRKETHTPAVEEEFSAVTGEGTNVSGLVAGGALSASLLPKTLPNPVNSAKEALRGRDEAAGYGLASLGQSNLREELQHLKSFLKKLKEDADVGIRRVEEVMGSLGCGGPVTEVGVGQNMGHNKAVGSLKPKIKRKNKRRRNKEALLKPKPKPGIAGVSLARDDAGASCARSAVETRAFLVGESSEAGARRAEHGASSPLPSILGKAKWVRKEEVPATLSVSGKLTQMGRSEKPQVTPVTKPASLSVLGVSTQLAPAEKLGCRGAGILGAGQMEETQTAPASQSGLDSAPASLSGLDAAGQGCCVVSDPPQLALAVAPGSRDIGFLDVGLPEEFQMMQTDVPGSSSATQGFFGAGHPEVCLTESEGTELDAFSEKASLMGEEGSMLVPWQSGNLFLDSGGVGSYVEEEPIPLEICLGRFGGERAVALPRLADSHGMELVPFVDGKPIPQDWKLALEIGDSDGVREVDKEMELIMVFRNIVGVSCDGHVERLKAAFAPILAGKKETKKNRGGGQVGRKGTREILNLFTSVNYEGGSGSVTRNRGKGRGNRFDL
jgi:hypothetical protein